MTVHMTHEAVIERLRAEALDDVRTGWLSDMEHFDPDFDSEDQLIMVYAPSSVAVGTIDLGQLAHIVQAMIEEATR